jgi:hypothetical protein
VLFSVCLAVNVAPKLLSELSLEVLILIVDELELLEVLKLIVEELSLEEELD